MPWRTVVPLIAVLGVLAACGDESAADRLCESRDDLRTAVDEVREDVTDANLGDARNALDDVTASFNQVRDAVTDLVDEQQAALQPAVDELVADVSALPAATSADDLQVRIDAVLTEVQAIYDQAATSVDCT